MKSSLLEIHQKLDNLQGSLNNVYQELNRLNGNTPENLNTLEVVNCTILPGDIELVDVKYNGENLTLEPAFMLSEGKLWPWVGPFGEVKTFAFKPDGLVHLLKFKPICT